MKSIFNIKSIFVVLFCFAALSANAQDNAALKAYKSGFPTKHKIVFGWFTCEGAWTGVPISRGGQPGSALSDLPDSIDCVSMWCWNGQITEDRRKDIEATKAKGTRLFLSNRTGSWGGELYKGGLYPQSNQNAEKFIEAIYDVCVKYKLNGFDWGHEDGMSSSDASMFIVALKKKFEEHNKTAAEEDKMYVCINIPSIAQGWASHYSGLTEEAVRAVDIFFWQTYDMPVNHDGGPSWSFYTVDTYLQYLGNYHKTLHTEVKKKSVMTSDFERRYRTSNFISLTKMAKNNADIMGVGGYRIQLDSKYSKAPFATIRQAIQILNPAQK